MAFDVTGRRQAQLEQQARREELAHLNRVSTVGVLSASIAHEVRQPLSVIVSSSEAALWMLRDGQVDPTETEEIFQIIHKSAIRANEVLSRIRSLVKKEPAVRTQVDANALIGETLQLVQAQMQRHGVEVAFEPSAQRPSFCGDRVQVQQVLLNLLINALEAMEGSQLPLRRIAVQVQHVPSRAVQISVADTGPGFAPGAEDRLFESFYTTKSRGLGMGLPICRTILEAHGGKLWAERNRDRGATFFLLLPIQPPTPSAEAKNPAQSTPPGCPVV